MDNDIRQMLRERADDMLAVPVLSPLTMQRAKRRRVRTAVGVGGMMLVAILGTVAGVNALRGPATIPFDTAINPVLKHKVNFQTYVGPIRPGYGSLWVLIHDSGGSVSRVDPRTGRVLATIQPGELPPAKKGEAPRFDRRIGSFSGLAVGQGAVWTIAHPVLEGPHSVAAQPQGVQTFRSEGRTSATFSMQAQAIGSEPSPMQIETLHASPGPLTVRPSPPPEMKEDQRWRLVRIDPRTNEVTIGPEIKNVWHPFTIAAGEGGVWVVGGGTNAGTLYRLDPKTLTLTHRIALPRATGTLSAGGGSIWVGISRYRTDPGRIVRIDPLTPRIASRIVIPNYDAGYLAVYNGQLWATSVASREPDRASLYRIDIQSAETAPVLTVPQSKTILADTNDLVSGEGFLWASLGAPGRIAWIDSTSGKIAGTSKVVDWPESVAVMDGYLAVNQFRTGNEYAVFIYSLQP